MMDVVPISVVLTTYHRADALEAALRALFRQIDRNFEIIVADDGSGPDTARVVESWQARRIMRVKHVWHEHKDFRGAEIRNRGIRASEGDYCIFLDGDCLPRADFVATHRRLAEAGWFVFGNRILLSPRLTAAILAGSVAAETWNLGKLARERLCGGINRLLPALRVPLGPLRKRHSNRWEGAKTCNLAVFRSDLDRIDGFDTEFTGWGLEDSDLVVRLIHAGVRRKDGRFATGVLHLWHPEGDRSRLQDNRHKLDEALSGNLILARRGLSRLRDEEPARVR